MSDSDSSGASGCLPACELDGQYEQDTEHDSPAEESRSPGHQIQHLPERLPNPAQHYRLWSALRPIYTPNASICLYGGVVRRVCFICVSVGVSEKGLVSTADRQS